MPDGIRVIVTAHALDRAEERLYPLWMRDTRGMMGMREWLTCRAQAALAKFGAIPAAAEFTIICGGVVFQMISELQEVRIKTVVRAGSKWRTGRIKRNQSIKGRKKPRRMRREIEEWDD